MIRFTKKKCSGHKNNVGAVRGRSLTWQNVDATAEVEDLPVSGPGDLRRRVCLDVTQQGHHVTLNDTNLLLLVTKYFGRH